MTAQVSAGALMRTHSELCFDRAFPQSLNHSQVAKKELSLFEESIEELSVLKLNKLEDSGIAGTMIRYQFSFHVCRWLAFKAPGEVSIDWSQIDDTGRIDELLQFLLQPSEDEYFDSGLVSSQDWIDLARADYPGTDFDWLLAQLSNHPHRIVLAQLYDAAEVSLDWNLRGSKYSRTRNVFPMRTVAIRNDDMRGRPRHIKKSIQEPVKSLRKLPRNIGIQLIDVAMASLAVRHRETLHFNHANCDEVYLASVGKGVSVVVFGLLPEFRYPLECTMGYLLLSNGIPIGYGGTSILFRQANTGLNLFDEYRKSEASYLWIQVMRVYHSLVNCSRYIVNPYQIGSDNDDALRSGAFWFYYKSGFRPVQIAIRELASVELNKTRRDKRHRSSLATLRTLASCDMHLTLPGEKSSDLFDEKWIVTSAYLATRMLGEVGVKTRIQAAERVAKTVAQDLRIRSLDDWSAAELRAFYAIAPFVAAACPGDWPVDEKRTMRKLLRAKGGDCEVPFARMLAAHEKFLVELRDACRRIRKSGVIPDR